MLESEAKKKLCPFKLNELCDRCVGARCMGWNEHMAVRISADADPAPMDPPRGECGMKPIPSKYL